MARCARTPEGTLTEDLIRFAVPVRPNCQGPRVPRVPVTFGRGEAPRVQIAKIPSSPPVPRATVITPGRGKARGQHEKRRKRRRGGLLIQAGSEAERGLPIQAGREAERGVLRAPEKGFQGRVGRARVFSKARRVADVGEGVPASRSRTARVVGKSIVARGALLPVTKLASKCHGCVQP